MRKQLAEYASDEINNSYAINRHNRSIYDVPSGTKKTMFWE